MPGILLRPVPPFAAQQNAYGRTQALHRPRRTAGRCSRMPKCSLERSALKSRFPFACIEVLLPCWAGVSFASLSIIFIIVYAVLSVQAIFRAALHVFQKYNAPLKLGGAGCSKTLFARRNARMRRARAGVQGVRAVRAGACRVCRMGGHGIRAGKACGVGAASANQLDGPGKPEHQRALFASFSKKEVPRRDQAHKTLRYHMRKLQRRRLSHRFPHPWRPIPFALSTVRNGRVALPQERLPSAPLLTGLPPRCIAKQGTSGAGDAPEALACGLGAPRLRPFAKGAFWFARFRALPEYGDPLGFTTPKRPLFERGWHAGDCRNTTLPRKACR